MEDDIYEDAQDFFEDEISKLDLEQPLYQGSRICLGEAIVGMYTWINRHEPTEVSVRDLLKFYKESLPKDNNFPETPYLFHKAVDLYKPEVKHVYYCGSCKREYADEIETCLDCSEKVESLLHLSIIEQLEIIMNRPETYDAIQKEKNRPKTNGSYRDVKDGSVHKEVADQFAHLTNILLLTFKWCTDGINIFKSSVYTIWPFFLTINELPYHLRRLKQNTILASIWFGSDKPDINLFIKHTKEEAKKNREGIKVKVPQVDEPISIHGIIISGICDLPAKAMALMLTLHSGYWGCNNCLQKGIRFMGKMVWPYKNKTVYRTDEQTEAQAQKALQTGKRVKGVIGVSDLSRTAYKSITGTAIDAMHCVYEGHVKYLLRLWFSERFKNEKYSLFKNSWLVDKFISLLTPPS